MSFWGDAALIGGLGAAGLATGGVINPGTAALIMGGTGLMAAKDKKNEQLDAQKRNAEAAAAQTRFSPYTKMGAGHFQATPTESVLGGGIAGATTGLQLSQNYNKAQNDQDLMKSQIDVNNAMKGQLQGGGINAQSMMPQNPTGFSPYTSKNQYDLFNSLKQPSYN